jgi:hypothetical protein
VTDEQKDRKVVASFVDATQGIYDLPFNWAWTKYSKLARYQHQREKEIDREIDRKRKRERDIKCNEKE